MACCIGHAGQQPVSSAYVTTLTFNGSCPSNVTSLTTSLSVELNRRAVCESWSSRLTDVCDATNYAVCPGLTSSQKHRRRARRQTQPPPLTVSIVLYVPTTSVPPHTHTLSLSLSLSLSVCVCLCESSRFVALRYHSFISSQSQKFYVSSKVK